MKPLVVVLALLVACSGGDEAAPSPEAAAPPPVAAPEAPPEPARPPIEDARALALAGDADGAFAAGLELLKANPEDDALWRFVEAVGVSPGRAAAALDAVTAAGVPPGKAGAHALLRAELALASGQPQVALDAALNARADDPGAAAALAARAVRAGAAPPEVSDPTADPMMALVRFTAAPDARKAAADAALAGEVAGWRAALLRGEVRAGWGDLEGALAELERAAADPSPRAAVLANIARAKLGLEPAKKGAKAVATPLEAGRWAAEAVRQARAEGDRVGLDRAVGVAELGLGAGGRPDELDDLLAGLLEVQGDAAPPALRLRRARSALAAGRPVAALAAASAAVAGLEGTEREDAAWIGTWAAFTLADAPALTALEPALAGARGQAARALALSLAGKPADAASALPSSGLPPADALRVARAGAILGGAEAERHLRSAVAHADAVGALGDRLATRLALEDHVRHDAPAEAARLRAELGRIAPAGGGMALELAVRAHLAGGGGGLGDGELPPLGVAWRGVIERQSSPVDGEGVAPIAAYAAARVALRGGSDPSGPLAELTSALPTHRRGRLASGTALDGSMGLPIGEDLDQLPDGAMDSPALAAALVLHEVGHRDARAREDVRAHVDRTAGLPPERRAALLDAAEALRAGVSRWQAGVAPFPNELLKALSDAERAAAEDPTFQRDVLPGRGPVLAEIRSRQSRLAVLSYVVHAGQVRALVTTPNSGAQRNLGPWARLRDGAAEHLSALVGSARKDGRASHKAGDALRLAMVDPFTGELTGHGWYAVIAPRELQHFLFTTFPEQATGLRWLADIRTIANLDLPSDVRAGEPAEFDPERFDPSYLVFAAPSPGDEPVGDAEAPAAAPAPGAPAAAPGAQAAAPAGAEVARPKQGCGEGPAGPLDVAAARRNFDPAFVGSCTGPFASVRRYGAHAPRARFLQIAGVSPSPDGGFVLADGALTLTDVRRTPLIAELVLITADGPPDVQRARARAFLDAGAQAVMISGWDVDDQVLERQLDAFWAALNRDRTVARALAESRESLMRDSLLGEDLDDPALWGSLVLYGTP